MDIWRAGKMSQYRSYPSGFDCLVCIHCFTVYFLSATGLRTFLSSSSQPSHLSLAYTIHTLSDPCHLYCFCLSVVNIFLCVYHWPSFRIYSVRYRPPKLATVTSSFTFKMSPDYEGCRCRIENYEECLCRFCRTCGNFGHTSRYCRGGSNRLFANCRRHSPEPIPEEEEEEATNDLKVSTPSSFGTRLMLISGGFSEFGSRMCDTNHGDSTYGKYIPERNLGA